MRKQKIKTKRGDKGDALVRPSVRDYLLEDIAKLTDREVGAVYKFVRRLIAGIS